MEFKELLAAFAAKYGIDGLDGADGAAELDVDGFRVEEPAPGSAASRVLTMNLLLKKGEGLSRFAATNGVGVAVFTNLSVTAQGWLYKPDWNMMRVTRRGPGVPAEWFTCDLSSYYLYFLMR